MLKISVLLLLISSFVRAENTPKQDLAETFEYFYKGSIQQFKEVNNLFYAVPAVATTYYSFEEDQRLSGNERSKKLRKIYDITGDMGVVFSFPVVPLALYYTGKKKANNKTVEFAKEYTAAMYLTLIETGIISYIPGHSRPNTEGQSMWETRFRGDNSFPSGHIVPYSVLFFKTLQYYGPYWATIPGVLTYFSAMQRVREGRHYVSDVVGSFWLSAFASEGVRAIAKNKTNHPLYKMIFERQLELSYIQYKGVIGPAFSYRF
ncbi:MAG: hypothetical protein BM556_12550 [Bacteriovorax sp. MedPE-SWde]|nr:MAG: hypothetical protein BM556_12550 [Bacteriovorax sp. MedPE-SWde]